MGSLAAATPRAVLLEAAAHSGPDEAKLTSHNSRWDSGRSNRGDFLRKIAFVGGTDLARAIARFSCATRVDWKWETKPTTWCQISFSRIAQGRAHSHSGNRCDCKLRANSHFSTGLQCSP